MRKNINQHDIFLKFHGIEVYNLPEILQNKIKGWNLLFNKLKEQKGDEHAIESLRSSSEKIAIEIGEFITKTMEEKGSFNLYEAFMDSEDKKWSSPISVSFFNKTDEKQKCSFFGIDSDNKNIEVINWIARDNENSFEILRLWLVKNQMRSELLRLQFEFKKNEELYFRYLNYTIKDPFGRGYGSPICIIGNTIHPTQHQLTISDINLDASFDGCSSDVSFELLPQEKVTLTLFPKRKRVEREHKNYFSDLSIIVENNSDTDFGVDLFSEEDYAKIVEGDEKDILLYHTFVGAEEFGGKMNYPDEKWQYKYNNTNSHLKQGKNQFDKVIIVKPTDTINPFYGAVINEVVRCCELKEVWKHEEYGDFKPHHLTDEIILQKAVDYNSFVVTIPAKQKVMFSFFLKENENKPTNFTPEMLYSF